MVSDTFIILAAGKPHYGDLPALLIDVNGQSSFDRQLRTLANTHRCAQVVIGYATEEFDKKAFNVTFHTNEKWATSGSGYSLLKADLSSNSALVSYADILYRPNLIEKLQTSHADITL